jgi:enoyl-CoA hydratase/carnithine racemase
MRGLLKGYSYLNANRFFYSNISLKFDSPNHAAYLTLTNEKKRNPMSLETIKEIRQALSEVSSKVENEKLKVKLK